MKIAWLEGDGIGPEITAACRQVLQQADDCFELDLNYDDIDIGFTALEQVVSTLPETAFNKIRECDGIVLGPVSHFNYPSREEGGINPSGELRVRLDLYANLRPAFTRPYIRSFGDHQFDLLIVRENTEGFYADRNMYGDILSDQATEMDGGLGLAASLNVGASFAMAQAQHGSAPDIAGQGIANPVSIIASVAMLLDWYNQRSAEQKYSGAAAAIRNALEEILSEPEKCTPDLGGSASTNDFAASVTDCLRTRTG